MFADKYFSAARFGEYGKRLAVQIFFSDFHAGSEGVLIRRDRGKKEREHFSLVCAFRILYHVCLLFHARSAYYVHETEEIYTATRLNLAKLTKDPSATYQIYLWPQRGQQVTS